MRQNFEQFQAATKDLLRVCRASMHITMSLVENVRQYRDSLNGEVPENPELRTVLSSLKRVEEVMEWLGEEIQDVKQEHFPDL